MVPHDVKTCLHDLNNVVLLAAIGPVTLTRSADVSKRNIVAHQTSLTSSPTHPTIDLARNGHSVAIQNLLSVIDQRI